MASPPCGALEKLRIDLRNSMLLLEIIDGAVGGTDLESTAMRSLVVTAWTAYEGFLHQLFGEVADELFDLLCAKWHSTAAPPPPAGARPARLSDLMACWPGATAARLCAFLDSNVEKTAANIDRCVRGILAVDPTFDELIERPKKAISARLSHGATFTMGMLKACIDEFAATPSTGVNISEFNITLKFDTASVTVGGVAIDYLIKLFYGSRCVFGHGNPKPTLETGALKGFPNLPTLKQALVIGGADPAHSTTIAKVLHAQFQAHRNQGGTGRVPRGVPPPPPPPPAPRNTTTVDFARVMIPALMDLAYSLTEKVSEFILADSGVGPIFPGLVRGMHANLFMP